MAVITATMVGGNALQLNGSVRPSQASVTRFLGPDSSCYKQLIVYRVLTLMAHSPAHYTEIGRLVADAVNWNLFRSLKGRLTGGPDVDGSEFYAVTWYLEVAVNTAHFGSMRSSMKT